MCHFYANPLSILLAIPAVDPETLHEFVTGAHLNAIRSLPSMRSYVEEKLAESDTDEVRSLLFDNSYLLSLLPQFVDLLNSKANEVRDAVIVLSKLCDSDARTRRGLGTLYLGVLTEEITPQTPFVREALMLQRYSPSYIFDKENFRLRV
jgi:hypothetical protein